MKKLKRVIVAVLVAALGCFGFAACGAPLTVTLDKESLTLEIGNSETLTATLSKEDEEVTWSTSAPGIATVANGIVTGVSEGTATITATAGDATATCAVTVQDTAIRRVTLSDDNLSLVKGSKYSVTVKLMEGTKEITGLNWNWTSEMAGIASVTANAADPSKGKITALGKGNATIFVSTTYRNKNYSGNVQLTVTDDVAFSLSPTAKELSAAEGGDYPNTAEFTYKLVINDETVTEGVSWRSENAEIASVDDTGRVTAHREGTVKIFAEYKAEGYAAYATVTVFPVEKTIEEEQYFGAEDDLVLTGDFDGITSVVRANGGEVQTESVADGLKLISDFEIGEHTLILKDGVYATSITFVRANVLISDKAGLDAWGTGWKPAGTEYVLLTADIPYNGSWVRALKNATADGYWDGTFDGRGHVISNIVFDKGSLVGDNFSGTVRNLVMTGVKVNKGGTGAITDRFRPAGTVSGKRTIENCYVSGTVNGSLSGLIAGYTSVQMGTIRNCVAVVEAPLPVGSSAIVSAFQKDETSYHPNLDIENCVVIGASAAMRNQVTGADYTPQNVTAACFTEISQLEGFDYTDMGFAAKVWDNAKPVPMPKGFAPDFEISATEATIAAGSEVTLSVNYPLTTLALKAGANDAGVTLDSGVVTVPLSAAGKSFTVTATAFDGTVREKTFEVLDIEEIPGVEDFGIANLTQTSVTWSTEGFDGAVRSITDLTGKTIAFAPGEENITVNAAEFGTNYGEQTYKILTDTNKRYTVKATVASYVISDLATLKGWQAAHKSGGTGYVVMTENVDFGGATWTGWGANSVWKGTFDGRGKTISNIKFAGTPLCGDLFEGEVKNLVMTGVELAGQFSSAISTRLMGQARIEDCYISGKLQETGHVQGLFVAYSNTATAKIRNCVAVVESGVTTTSKTSAIVNGYPTGCPQLENCIVIGAPKAVSEAVGFGATTSESLNVEGAVCLTQASELDSFDYSEMDFTASLWATAGKVPVPKGLSLNLTISTSVPEAEISAGSAITLSANYPLTKFTFSEAIEGITLEGNTLTIADSAAGKSFTVVATGFDGTTAQKTLTVVAIEDMPGVTDFNAFDLSKGTVSISTADFDGAVKSFADASGSLAFTAGESSIEVAPAIFGTERGERTFTIVTDANKRYQAKAVVADYVISDVESLNGWQSFAKVKTTAFVALAAEIDYGSNTFSGDGLTYFGGIFDGRGHTISNIKFNTTGLCGDNMAGIVRNLAVKNTEISGNAGAIAGRLGGVPGGLIENCFVSGKVPGTKLAGLFVGYVSTDAQRGIKNCMAVVENAPENNRSGAFVGGFTGYPHWTIAGSVVVGSVAPVVMSEDGSASTEENLDALTYADAAAFETGAADAVAKLGSAWSWDAETKTLSLSGTAVYTVTAA